MWFGPAHRDGLASHTGFAALKVASARNIVRVAALQEVREGYLFEYRDICCSVMFARNVVEDRFEPIVSDAAIFLSFCYLRETNKNFQCHDK